ncbi:MAG: inositol-3-phosphate synthase [Thermoguttaceae bacterium]|nr:inositol-3-phosphate synthase [Thermoguttaceae bacterium]MDW8036980.1 inositol-3-phosphate synthase [Thermoguttaceae bacterium]
MTKHRIGVWLIGAQGGVATTTIVGCAALARGLVEPIGLVSALEPFRRLGLIGWDRLVFAGHEIRKTQLYEEAMHLVRESRALEASVVEAVRDDLEAVDRRIRFGTVYRVGAAIEKLASPEVPREGSARQIIKRLQADFTEFVQSEQLAHLVVVNVASTEPPADEAVLPKRWAELEPLLDRADCPLPASSLYAIAALQEGHSYINFTPSLGSRPTAISELARLCGTRHMGCDGKTGETLLKSVLAPMFAQRNLRVMSWVGHNIFGNMDAQILNDPQHKQTKLVSKDRLLAEILGYRPQTHISIEYIQSLGDWKTAWDHVHFQGFLGTPMVLQFIWQGCDSLLAAPLVLDLVRFTELAWRHGQTGTLTFLASFFKSPYEVSEHRFDRQYQMLEAWAQQMPTSC